MKENSTEYSTIKRRQFLKSTLIGSISLTCIPPLYSYTQKKLDYSLELNVPTKLFDGERCWCHPRAGIVPGSKDTDTPSIVMTINKLDLAGSDVFYGMYGLLTNNLGKEWTNPKELKTLAPKFEIIDGIRRPVAVSDFWPKWHNTTKTLLGVGHTVVYTPNWKVANPRPRSTAYSIYDIEKGEWGNWQKLEMPDKEKFYNAGAGCVQRYDLKNGDIFLPIYFRPKGKNSRVTVCKCSYDGKKLKYLAHGTELELNNETRGLGEPSLTKFKSDFFLTIRNDKKSFVARSKDGLHYDTYQTWKFDDGTELGSYNTQQHWLTHSEGLFLVYTRKGADNDHVFRHRAPLFMAEVDPEKLCVIKATEQILVPERGARLGNFGVTHISPGESWVTVSEWMQPEGVEKYGSDGSVFVAKIKWNHPNCLFS
ncbi:exo-alpha-sialidase [Arenibacter aquaticus]|uniref:Exo-alpha-sialidase n=1 Tax=Arenibacter aquaticus TaxID=2489054 RepID=A0A3S0BUI7_9FLAO|nr:sialidase family protein [Arenibacter aquaticus]RTE51890.1 exo-alpha-sialidase [Arenibacter aquaticus]